MRLVFGLLATITIMAVNSLWIRPIRVGRGLSTTSTILFATRRGGRSPFPSPFQSSRPGGGGGGRIKKNQFSTSKMRDENDGASTNTNNKQNKHHEDGVRLNKCIPSMSRRSADDAIQKGSVTVNGEVMRNPGHRVTFKDVVKLDGEPQKWQEGALAKRNSISSQRVHEERNFIYLKYWKPRGVTCTADPADPTNIIAAGGFQLFPQRVFTVGRLDKDSTGLILLTSDGRLNHALLGTKFEANALPSIAQVREDTPAAAAAGAGAAAAGAGAIVGSVKEKVYVVEVGPRAPTDSQVQRLREGVVITTEVQKDTSTTRSTARQRKVEVSARTLPCRVRRLPASPRDSSSGSSRRGGTDHHHHSAEDLMNNILSSRLEFTLVEGRNRQIRKMVESVGLKVLSLHRTAFANVTLRGLSEGSWAELSEREMEVIEKVIATAQEREGEGERERK